MLNKISTEYITLSIDEYYFELQSDKNLTMFNYAWLIQMSLRDLWKYFQVRFTLLSLPYSSQSAPPQLYHLNALVVCESLS